MADKAALAEFYNGRPEDYGRTPAPCGEGSSTSQGESGGEPSSMHLAGPSDNSHLPSYQESVGHDVQPTIATVPSAQPNRPGPLPMVYANQVQPILPNNTGTVIVNPPVVTSQTSVLAVVTQPQSVISPPAAVLSEDGALLDERQYYTTFPRPFMSGICNCCMDCQTCVCGTFCPCCFTAALASKLNESTMTGLCCMAGLVPLRTKLRLQHNIYGSICDDICLASTCPCCVLCQMGREMKTLKYPTKCCCC